MPLHTDFRPDSLETFIGNKDEMNKLRSVLTREDKPHAFLFVGPRGCGKTTLGRIAAKMVGCHDNDIMEIDVTTNRGIDSAKELKDSLMYRPLNGKAKAYILDEVHQGTTAFFNALLKPLEEPPEHAFFFLCTTEGDSLLKTVKSRCFPFNVSPLSRNDMTGLLTSVIESEGVDFDAKWIREIVERSEGIPREALIMLDSVIDLPTEQIESAINKIKTTQATILDLCKALLEKKSWKIVSELLKNVKEEPEKVRWSILGYMHSVLTNPKGQEARAAVIISEFSEPFFNNGKAGLAACCYLCLE